MSMTPDLMESFKTPAAGRTEVPELWRLKGWTTLVQVGCCLFSPSAAADAMITPTAGLSVENSSVAAFRFFRSGPRRFSP